MILLQAPYPNIETATALPSPEFSDVENPTSTISVRKSMNNTLRTYVKKRTRHSFTYNISMSRAKAIELERFIKLYNEKLILLTNHKDEEWIVNLTSNPFEFTLAGSAQNFPGGEYVTLSLSFEGILNA